MTCTRYSVLSLCSLFPEDFQTGHTMYLVYVFRFCLLRLTFTKRSAFPHPPYACMRYAAHFRFEDGQESSPTVPAESCHEPDHPGHYYQVQPRRTGECVSTFLVIIIAAVSLSWFVCPLWVLSPPSPSFTKTSGWWSLEALRFVLSRLMGIPKQRSW